VVSKGSAENLIRGLKESLQRLELLESLPDEQEAWVEKVRNQIRAKIAELNRG
jgi:hypothetical protein